MASPDTSSPGMASGLHLTAGYPDVFASRPRDLDYAVGLLRAAVVPQRQEPARQEILGFCQHHPDALFRSCLDGHLTASVFVVDTQARAVALIHHRKLGRWLQPGGHADGEGNLALVAATEVAEEVGLDELTFAMPAFDIDIHAIPARGEEPRHLHLDLRFLAIADSDRRLRPNEETLGAAWVGGNDPRIDQAGDVAVAVRRAVDLAQRLSSP